ncbi:MAG: type II toxin-antitoxin system HicB family antitoxin [Chloroflexia bacterium]|nr:type II toxin-antitoxin system HicB family antitoxin [Chloroflexia bacterium]
MRDDRYRIELFWSNEDQSWIANIPELKYCSAHGDSPEEALAEVRVAMTGWLEAAREIGAPIPEPARPVPA